MRRPANGPMEKSTAIAPRREIDRLQNDCHRSRAWDALPGHVDKQPHHTRDIS